MNERLLKFLAYFLLFFSINTLGNWIFKQELNLLTTFSVALGVSGGMVFLGPFIYRKFSGSA